MTRLAINGLGRIGKLLLRRLLEGDFPGEIVLLNDRAGDAALHAHLLAFDTVHGRFGGEVQAEGEAIVARGRRMRFASAATPEALPLRDLGVDLLADCTGSFKTPARLQPYFDAGVRTVLVSAPVKAAPALNLVFGVNHELYDPHRHRLLTAASCTTNCLAPVVKVLHEGIGIRHGSITTVHDVTNTQTIVDRPHKDWRRARSALNSLVPTTTGSATAIGLIYPELEGRLNGHAIRVPLLNASLTDCVFEMKRPTEVAEVNELFRIAAEGSLAGILGYETRPLVSADYRGDPRSAVLDAPSTMVVGGTQVKVYAWYDNEWAYACRMADLLRLASGR